MGPQKSKKQKENARKSGATTEKRIKRNAALLTIRQQFQPFDVQKPARPSKFQFANSPDQNGASVVGRPGVTKGRGEETVCLARYPTLNETDCVL